ncbi:lytic polysaccharide monooxygenase [Hypholoma sublateritium FD-334 SS-4]|uniref:AA9 family lytic polysaccharide monooxygenase n=1 Tax=Hypholoma sublateritium (strain FD-334 SS-4) TaxID=945553 RepID=A0A0D2PIA4_HYPSF|nr:lytic polysaccharide monooxygenase [Hypholoma sublateritium FD-334 SS-4]
MFSIASLVVIASLLVSQAAAHGSVTSYVIGLTTFAGSQPYSFASGHSSIERPYSIILAVTDQTVRCNNNGQPSSGQLSATVVAGTSITAKWSQWTQSQGPVIVYMANCNKVRSSVNSNTLKWLKIAQTGLISGKLGKKPGRHPARRGTGIVVDTLAYTSTIPAALAPGDYLIRHQLLAIHQANTPQSYPECAQLTVTGSGKGFPSGSFLTMFPGTYRWDLSASDPSININIYDATTAACLAPV